MKNTTLALFVVLTSVAAPLFAQKFYRNYGEPILTDTLSTLFIPVQLSDDLLAANKLSSWEYYANIIVYNFQTDTYKTLFDKDTFIQRIVERTDSRNAEAKVPSKWIFLLVKNSDTNKNGRIDEKDATILFAVSSDGSVLRKLTEETENVIGYTSYLKQGFILIKMQLDSDHDNSFRENDKEFYLRKVNITDLAVGNKIEIRPTQPR